MKTIVIIFILLISHHSQALRMVVETHKKLNVSEQEKLKNDLNLTLLEDFYPKAKNLEKLFVIEMNDENKDKLLDHPFIKSSENVFALDSHSLVPGGAKDFLVPDYFFLYQWGLHAQNQTMFLELDDINSIKIPASPKADIGFKEILMKNYTTSDLVVAVLDTGIDLNHPEFQGQLWKNTLECESTDRTLDVDGNGLPGDCDGWNFTYNLTSPEAKIPADNDGHGTHVAGIIGAKQDNVGIVGVASHLKIMPVKIIRDSDVTEVPTSDAFARGIYYAVNNGAKVINLSLGWPRSLETRYLREAVFYALEKGVILVAASGNNNSSEPNFPCAYEGVICVGATTINKDMAGFSNYGSHVDTLAPGERILSTYPISYGMEPLFFFSPGYEMMNGTSQSAPFITGLIGTLLNDDPSLKLDDLLARLYRNRVNYSEDKYVLGGLARFDELNVAPKGSLITPLLKRFRQIVYSGENFQGEFVLAIKNFGDKGSAKIQLTSLNPGFELIDQEIDVLELDKYQDRVFKFRFKIKDWLKSNLVKFKITISENESTYTTYTEVPVARDLRQDSLLTVKDFEFLGEALPVGVLTESKHVRPIINTLTSSQPDNRVEYVMRKLVPKDQPLPGLELTLFRQDEIKIYELNKKIFIPEAVGLIHFIRTDLNYDGIEDYFVMTLHGEEKNRYAILSFFNHNLEPLWEKFPLAKLDIDVYVKSLNTISFYQHLDPHLGKMKIVSFITEGGLPNADQVLDPWAQPDTFVRKRLYHLVPDIELGKVNIRTISTHAWYEKIKQTLNLKWNESVSVEKILSDIEPYASQGTLRVLVSAGYMSKRDLYVLSINPSLLDRSNKLTQLVLQTDAIKSIFSVGSNGLELVGDLFLNIYDQLRTRLLGFEAMTQTDELTYIHDKRTDYMLGQITSFKYANSTTHLLSSRDKLISISVNQDGQSVIQTKDKLRYSFLSNSLLQELYFPLMFKREDSYLGALYIDATSITGNRIYILEDQKEGMIASMKNSLLLPPQCQALNPSYEPTKNTYQVNFLCFENNKFVLKNFALH